MPLHAVVLLCAGLACLAPAEALRAGLALHPGRGGRASISPAQFRVLDSINNIEERELSMLMSAAAEDGGRRRLAGRSEAQEEAALARFMRTQAMSGSGSGGGVPGICPAPCKSAWASLTANYKTYFECQPKCAETVIKEKTKYSDMIDKECLQLGACWEAIEAEIFRPGSASGEGSGADEDEEAGGEAGDGDGDNEEGAGLNGEDDSGEGSGASKKGLKKTLASSKKGGKVKAYAPVKAPAKKKYKSTAAKKGGSAKPAKSKKGGGWTV